ncbi:MAG: hypothetical protein ABSF64_01495 [Bryobacteraceae bacterium]|jgi:uncharacterized protein (TIGR03437 family)
MPRLKLPAGSYLAAFLLFPFFGQAQTISIVSGNGQLVCPECTGADANYTPLVAQVNDAAGSPVANTTVTWTTTQQGLQPVTSTSVTNSAGAASYTLAPLAASSGYGVFTATVVASALNASVQFIETTAKSQGLQPTPAFANLISPTAPPALSGSAGQTAGTPITVGVTGPNGPIPGIQLALRPSIGGPMVSCETQPGQQAGTVLTDSTGTATCTPVFGGQIGLGTYTIYAGGNFAAFGPAPLSVTPGPPAVIRLISGNNQSVNAGVRAPLPLVAEVTDLAGNPSAEATVKWSVTEGTATLSGIVATALSNGQVSAYVTPAVGPVEVSVALGGNSAVQAIFTVNVNAIVTVFQTVSGNNQQAQEGAAFTEPLIVQVNDGSVPVPGAAVSFAVSSGAATLSAGSAITNAQGQAQVTVTAGATAGPVAITAGITSTNATYTQTFNLVVVPPGPIVVSVVNSAGFQNQFISPCSLATIYGTGLTPGLQGVAAAFIEPQTQVAGVSVQFAGVPAPILDVANINGVESVSLQVPCETPAPATTPPGTVPMVVTVDNVAAAPFNAAVLPISPGIFQFVDSDGQTRAVLIRPDGSFASVANPTRPGDTIRMFVTGLGQTTPTLFTNEFDPLVADANGDLVAQTLAVDASVVVGVNNNGVAVISAKYAYGMVGVYEVDFQVPQDAAAGNNAPLAIAVVQGTKLLFGNASLIAIQ